MRISPKYYQSIAKMLDFYSQFNPSPLSIKKFIDFGELTYAYYKMCFRNFIYFNKYIVKVS